MRSSSTRPYGRSARRAGSGLAAALSIALLAGLAAPSAQDIQSSGDTPRQDTPPQRPPVFRGGANYVVLDAYPRKDGQIVEGLTAKDFQVFEDGKPQTVESVEFVRVEAAAGQVHGRDPNTVAEMRALAADVHNRVFVTFLDTLHTTADESHDARAPLIDALDRMVGPNDLFGVMTQDMRPGDLTLGRGLQVVAEQLTRYWTWGERSRLANARSSVGEDALTSCFHTNESGAPWLVNDAGVRRPLDETLIDVRREDEVLTALGDVIDYMGQIRDARTALLVVSDGWRLQPPNPALARAAESDSRAPRALPHVGEPPIGGGGVRRQPPSRGGVTTSMDYTSFATCLVEAQRLAEVDGPRRMRDLIALAGRRNVSVYPIAMSRLAVSDGSPGSLNDLPHLVDRANGLRTIAEGTGGLAVVGTNDIAGGLRRVADDLSAYYLLGYYSTNQKMDGRLRRIEVKMTPPGLSVHARTGYFAPRSGPDAAPVPAAVAAANAAVAEALGPLDRLRPSSDLFVHGARRGDDLAIAVELSAHQTGLDRWAKGAVVTLQVADGSGQALDEATAALAPGARSVLAHVPVGAGAGPWHVSARVTAAGGSISDTSDIPAASHTFIGDALLFRATPSPRSALRPVADFQFRAAERVHVEWPILQPLDQRTARLLDRRGQPLPIPVTLTERESDGASVVAADLPLGPLAAGDYLIELVVGRQGTTERRLVGLRVVR